MKKQKISEMRGMYAGRVAAVLGGGPSLPDDMRRVPSDALLIAVNYHGLYHCPEIFGRDPDYLVYNDVPSTNPLMVQAVEEHRVPLVSPEPTSDIEFDAPVWTGFFSSNTATWLALWMGCDPVILCGMDCYQGPVKHCAPSTYHSPMFDMPLDFYTRPWVEEGLKLLPNVERVKVVSGPLVGVFGAYA